MQLLYLPQHDLSGYAVQAFKHAKEVKPVSMWTDVLLFRDSSACRHVLSSNALKTPAQRACTDGDRHPYWGQLLKSRACLPHSYGYIASGEASSYALIRE